MQTGHYRVDWFASSEVDFCPLHRWVTCLVSLVWLLVGPVHAEQSKGFTSRNTLLQIPVDPVSLRHLCRYADINVLALSKFRSQGSDRFASIPVPAERLTPESFLLVKSVIHPKQTRCPS